MADEIIVRIRAEGQDKFIKDMQKAGHSVEEVGDSTEKTTKKMGTSFNKLIPIIGAAFATQKLIDFTKELAKTAIEIDATNAKITKVFGESSRAIEDFARKNANALGLTVNEYKKAAAAAGDLLVPLGFQRRQAAALSNDLIKLSGALAAWSGGQLTATQTSEILTKALLGEREQLKQLGIQITEADVKNKLLEKGQKNLTGSTLAQAKATATLELITEKSTDAQNAFSDSTKTLAEQQGELSASVRQFKDDLAVELIPTLNNLFTSLNNNVIPKFRDFLDLFRGDRGEISTFKRKINDLNQDQLKELSIRTTNQILLAEQELENLQDLQKEYENLPAIQRNLTSSYLNRIQNQKDLIKELENELTAIKDLADFTKTTGGDTNDEIVKQVRSLEFLNEELKKQQQIIKTSEPFGDEFNTAARNAERLKNEIKGITDALKDMFKQAFDPIEGADVTPVLESIFIGGGLDDIESKVLAGQENIQKLANEAYAESLKERAKLAEIEAEETRMMRLNKAQQGIDGINQLQQTAFSFVLTSIDNELSALEEKNSRGLISEKEYQKQRSEILNKQAKAQKASSIIEASVGTALAIVQALNAPPPASFVFSALAAAIGAAQIAFISSQPTPQFAKGTKGTKKAPKGFAWVGEEGPELMQLKGGEKIITHDDSQELVNLLGGYGIPVQFKTTHESLYKPMKTLDQIKSNDGFDKVDWSPLISASETQRMSLGKKLDKVNDNLVKMNNGLNRRMTKA